MEIKSGDTTIRASEDIIGSFPIQTYITTIAADDKRLKLDFKVYEQSGTEVFKLNGEKLTIEKIRELTAIDTEAEKQGIFRDKGALTHFDDIKVGDEILVCGFFDDWFIATIDDINEKEQCAYANDGGNTHFLSFAKDERKCWIRTSFANNKAIDMINVMMREENKNV